MTDDISPYEQRRLDNIKRNQLFLEELNIADTKPKPAKEKVQIRSKRAKIEANPDFETRRISSRNSSKPPGFFSESSQFSMTVKDEDTDEDYDDNEDKDVDFYDDESIPLPTKQKQRVNKELAHLSTISEDEPVIKLERAKTGRSSCRKCRDNIEQDTMRVGMKAWIMGRSSWTWSHPVCFTSLIALNRDSGRGKCKITSYKFDINEIKVTCTSHTANVNMCLTAAAKILEDVINEDPSYSISNLIATLEDISAEEEASIREAFQSPTKGKIAAVTPEDGKKHVEDKDKDEDEIKTNLTKQDQPVAGVKTGATGQVAWKFAGHVCYGILIPKSETATHCYAKTHKGNIKTLAKGLPSWWLLG